MVQMKWMALTVLGLLVLQANAEEAVVIDAQTIGQQSGASTSNAGTPEPVVYPADANDANRTRVLKGGRMSLRQKVAVDKATLSDNNKQQGEDFFATNKARQGVVSLPSGVQYEILRAGKGRKPTDNSIVVCRYRGTLIDGTQFESDAGKPVALHVVGFVPGLKEAVKLMSTGSKWRIVVPPQLAYGEVGNRGVGPNAVLIYDLEIISIK